MKKVYRNITLLVSSMLLWACGSTTDIPVEKLTVEAAPADVTMVVRGVEKPISFVNPSTVMDKDGSIVMLTADFTPTTGTESKETAVVLVDANNAVVSVIPAGTSAKAQIPENGFALLASETQAETGVVKYLSENFKKGDVIKIRLDGQVIALGEVAALGGKNVPVAITLSGDKMYTTLNSTDTICGAISGVGKGFKVSLTKVGGATTEMPADSVFALPVELSQGVNYFDIAVTKKDKKYAETSVVVFYKTTKTETPDVVMWVEQFPNAKTLRSDADVEEMVLKSKNAGVTSFGLDVKGPEGFVSYKKTPLSHSLYYTNIKHPKKALPASSFDLLKSMVRIAHKHGMRVYASFNSFTEGNVTLGEGPMAKAHPQWVEMVQRPEDKGAVLPLTESTFGKKAAAGNAIAITFVNPLLKEVQDYQLLRIREVIENYDVDAIVLDRCRYDNIYGDFSPASADAFKVYLEQKGKKLEAFPSDAFAIDSTGNIVRGQHFTEWITFRSGIVHDYVARVRALIDEKKAEKPNLKLSAYVGSWYEAYWQNGVNWASPDFRYDSRLGFPETSIYTEDYYKTAYLPYLDFLMIGTYFKTDKEVNKYITLGNILTNGQVPIYGSMSMPDLIPEQQAEVFGASLRNSAGLMIFDHCYVQWDSFTENMQKAFSLDNIQER